MKNASRIQAILNDHTTSSAYAWLEQGGGYGHMNIKIQLTGKYHRPDGVIKITSQIGSTFHNDEQSKELYAQKFGFDADCGSGSLGDLKVAIKAMRKIHKKLDQFENDVGSPKSFAEYCQRILIGAGVKWLISEHNGWACGGSKLEKALRPVGAESMRELERVERILIDAFTHKTA